MKEEFDMAWGNPYFLLELLNKSILTLFTLNDIGSMSYAPDNGIPDLIEKTRDVIFKTTGLKYDNIFITSGATQSINSILKYKKNLGYTGVVTGKYGYPFYQDMIENSGLERVKSESPDNPDINVNYNEMLCTLLDSPSNPEGIVYGGFDPKSVIWDSVYHNQIYLGDTQTSYPAHEVMVGSYSKLLGLTGARVGYVAANNKILFDNLADFSLKDIATVSIPSQQLIIEILNSIDLDLFMKTGNKHLNYNRENVQKLEYLFDNQPIQEVGMFYCAYADKKTVQLLKKCGIKYVDLGDDYIRLSLGQTMELTEKAVKLILKKDNNK